MLTYTTPAAQLGADPDQRLADAWWNYASPANWSPGAQVGQLGLRISGPTDYTSPIYLRADSTKTIPVYRSPVFYDSTGRFSTIASWPVRLPWADDWQPATGGDKQVLVDDDETGAAGYELVGLRPKNGTDDFLYSLVGITLPSNARMADAVCRRTPANVGKFTGHGAGRIPNRAGILTAAMAANGVTEAISYAGFNVANGPGAGYRLPASRVEHPGTERKATGLPQGNHPRTVPHGTRWHLTYSPADVLDLAADVDASVRTAFRNIVTGLCVYGWIQDETSGSSVGSNERTYLESTGTQNETEAAAWAALGLETSSDFTHLLDGVFTRNVIEVVAVPGTVQPATSTRTGPSVAAIAAATDD